MFLGLNTNSYNKVSYRKNFTNSSCAQELSFGMQSRPIQNIQSSPNEVQNSSKKSIFSKVLIGAALLAAGSIATVLVFKFKGKTPANTTKAVETIKQSADKVEASNEGANKPGLLQKIKDKTKSFFADVKKGFSEYEPVPESSDSSAGAAGKAKKGKKKQKPTPPSGVSGSSNPKPATSISPLDALNTCVAAKLTDIEAITSSITKISTEAEDLTKAIIQSNNDTIKALENSSIEEWASKIIGDFSSTASSVKKAGFIKINAFDKIDADNWQYCEGFSKSLRKTTSKAKRRIKVSPDEIKVVINNRKDCKKNIETAEQLYKFDKNTGVIQYFNNYRVSQNGTEYSKAVTLQKDNLAPETVMEGYQQLQDGTVKIRRITENGANGRYGMYSEDVEQFADGKETLSKMLSFDAAKPEFYMEGYTRFPDKSYEALKEIDIPSGLYYEGSKVAADGTQSAQKKIQYSNSGQPLAFMEEYARDAVGVETAKVKIEYTFGTGEPKYYFENYSYSPTDGEKYSLKAEFKDGKWIQI